MALYVVMATSPVHAIAIQAKINAALPDLYRQINDYCWLVVGSGTAKEITEKIGINRGPETAVVVASSGYFGFAGKDIWEWIATKSELA